MRIKEHCRGDADHCLRRMMGRGPRDPSPQGPPRQEVPEGAEGQQQEERRDTFQFTAKLPPKKLRCLNL